MTIIGYVIETVEKDDKENRLETLHKIRKNEGIGHAETNSRYLTWVSP